MVKQVIIIRKDLNMRKGKIASQACHASMKVILDSMREEILDDFSWSIRYIFTFLKQSAMDVWINGSFTKICVYCESEEDLLNYYNIAKTKEIPCSLITDLGLTEFHGVPTHTCVAIGPWWSEEIDKITGDLNLL